MGAPASRGCSGLDDAGLQEGFAISGLVLRLWAFWLQVCGLEIDGLDTKKMRKLDVESTELYHGNQRHS